MNRRGGKGKPANSAAFASTLGQGEVRGFMRVTAGDDLGQLNSSDFQLAFKKLNKRDSITKLKGLQELKTLFEDIPGKGEDVDAVIQAWVYSFLRLAADDDPKVRVALCNTFANLVQIVKKKLAAHLKRIMGTWLCLQFDQSNEVATAAKKSFQAAFPAKKHSEVLLFCKSEILDHLTANFAQTPQTLAGEHSKDKAEDRYSNLMFSSLLGLRYFIETIPEAENQALAESRYTEIMDKKFWNFLKDKKHLFIRRAAYQLLAVVSTKAKVYMETNLSWLTSVIVGLLNDTESSNQSQMWEALLIFFKHYPDAWSHINARKQFFGPLWVILRNGTSGSAAITYPSMLPLLSLIPKDVIGEGTGFHKEFFVNLWKGLGSENFSDASATRLISAYMECLLYFIISDLRNESRPEGSESVAAYLVAGPLFDATQYYLTTEKVPSTLVKAISGLIGKLTAKKTADDLVISYISKVGEDVRQTFSESRESLSTYCNRLSALLLLLASDKTVSVPGLDQLVRDIVAITLPKAKENGEDIFWVQLLSELAAAFPELVFGTAAEAKSETSFFTSALLPWIVNWASTEARDELATPLLFDILYNYFEHVSSQKEELHGQWERIVTEVIATGRSNLLLQLLRKVCRTTSNEQWSCKQLDDHAIHLFNALQAGASSDTDTRLLGFLISGANNQSSPLLSPTCFSQILDSIAADLANFTTAHSFSDDASPEFNQHSLSSLKDLLDLTHYIASSCLPATIQSARASLLGGSVFRLYLLAALTQIADQAQEAGNSAKTALTTFATSRLHEASAEVVSAFRSMLTSTLHEAILHIKAERITAASDVAVQIMKWVSAKDSEDEKKVVSELTFSQEEWRKARAAVPGAINNRETSSLYIRLTGSTHEESADDDSSDESYARMAFFTMELLTRLSAPVVLTNDKGSLRTWLVSYLLQSFSLAGVALIVQDDEAQPTLSPVLLMGASEHIEHEEEDDGPSAVWSLLAKHAPHGVAIVSMSIISQFKETDSDSTSELVKKFVSDAQQQLHGATSLAFVLRLIASRTTVPPHVLASALLSSIPLTYESDERFDIKLSIVEASIPVIADATSEEVVTARTVAEATFSSLKEANITGEEDARRALYAISTLAAFYWPAHSAQPTDLGLHLETLASLFPKGRWAASGSLPHALMRGLRTAALRLTYAVASKSSEKLARTSWDFVLEIVKSALVDTKAKAKGTSVPDVMDATEALRLLCLIMHTFKQFQDKEQGLPIPEEKYHSFLSKLLPQIVDLFISVGLRLSQLMEKDNPLSVLLERVIRNTPSSLLCKHISSRESDDSVHAVLSCPDWLLQKTAYRLLLHKLMAIAAISDDEKGKDKESETASEEDSDAESPLPPALQAFIEQAPEDLHGLLGFMLGWSLVLDHCTLRSAGFRAGLGSFLRRSPTSLHLFMRVLCQHLDLQHPQASASLPPAQQFKISDMKSTSDEWISAYAAHLYLRLLQAFPALVRLWWTDDCDRQTATKIEKYTTTLMSPILIENELAAIANYKSDASNFQVKASKVSREVIATYEKDELCLAVVMRLAASYPLRSVEIETKSRLGVSEAQWRKWMLSMTTLFLTHDGTLLDGVLLWKQNLDKHFEGVECCPICYSLFHISDHSLPRLSCKTCHNKFHSACMYKWIRVSHNTDCPLCKTPFN